MSEIRVSEIVVFPIKSLRGVSLPRWTIEKRGLQHDRRWMLVDSDGVFLTQRKLYNMALFDTEILESGLRVHLDGRRALDVPYEPCGAPRVVQVWSQECEAMAVSDEADAWFTEALGQDCSLVYMPESTQRPIRAGIEGRDDIVGFADAHPILVAGLGSIDDLNSRMEAPIPIRRFRANLVLSGSAAFAEDEWTQISIGPVELTRTRQCGRCAVPTIDIETGRPSDEPLRTLNAYRKFDTMVCFGSYYVPDAMGAIAVGDLVLA